MRLAAAVAIVSLSAGAAKAQDRPTIFPTRDVDVTYRLPVPDAVGGRALEQRMRFTASGNKQRVDPPTPGLYIVMDFAAHSITTVRPEQRMALDMPTAAVSAGTTTSASYTRRGEASVAGLACTLWVTRAASGEGTEVCMTDDGVLLRAVAAGRILLEATKVRYATQEPGVFAIPEGFKRLAAPPPPPAR